MNFLSKQIGRFGKTSENYRVTFVPLELKVNVFDPDTEYQLVFKRGPQKDPTKRYKAISQKSGMHMQTVEFDGEIFSRVSGFYKEKDGTFQEKKAKVKIVSFLPTNPEGQKVCSVPFNLSDYIGRGVVKESLQLTGNAYYCDFEIHVDLDTSGDPRASMAITSNRSTMQPQNDRATMQPQSMGGLIENKNYSQSTVPPKQESYPTLG